MAYISRLGFFIIFTFGLLAGSATYFRWFERIDVTLFDTFQRLNQETYRSDISVIEIDEQSLEVFGQWPWSRRVHAKLIETLHEAGVNSIVFDVIFAEASQTDPEGDRILSDAIAMHRMVTLPVFIGQATSNGLPFDILPFPELLQAGPLLGHIHLHCDDDSICRSFYLREGSGVASWPHVAMSVINAEQGIAKRAVKGIESPLAIARQDKRYLLFPKSQNTLNTISYLDILNGNYNLDSLKGHTVFVGATAAGFGDTKSTPVGLLPGVHIHALIYSEIINDHLVVTVPVWIQVSINAVAVVMILMLLARLPPAAFLVGVLMFCVISMIVSSVLLLYAKQWFFSASMIVWVILFYPLWSWLKIHFALKFILQHLGKISSEKNYLQTKLVTLEDNNSRSFSSLLGITEVVTQSISKLHYIDAVVDQQRFIIESTLGSLDEGVILAEPAGRVLMLNDRAKEITGLNQENNIALTLSDLIPLKASTWSFFFSLIDSKASRIELTQTRKKNDGHEHTVYIMCDAIVKSFTHEKTLQANYILLSLVDITGLKMAEERRLDTLHFLSHDLRSPMVSVLAVIENYTHNKEQVTVDGVLEKIKIYTNKNLSYSESILQLSKANDINESNFTYVDVHALIDSAYWEAKDQALAKSIKILVKRDDADCWVMGEADLLGRALLNLLSNAIKYIGSGRKIQMIQAFTKDKVAITIADDGIGIEPELQKKLFDRFEQGSHKKTKPGVGLGLFFVKTVMDKHSGSVSIVSAPDVGTQITIELPLAQPI